MLGKRLQELGVSFSLGRVGFFGHRCRNIFLPLPSVPACPDLLPRNFCFPPRFLSTSTTASIFSVSTRNHFSSSISCHHITASSTPALGQAIQYWSVSRSPGRSRFFTTSTSNSSILHCYLLVTAFCSLVVILDPSLLSDLRWSS
jgi:hypothetical protein